MLSEPWTTQRLPAAESDEESYRFPYSCDLTAAGRLLDQAALAFRRLCDDRSAVLTEEGFAAAEQAYAEARVAYLEALANHTGQSVADLERR